ncbi:MAG: TrmH family RNA methyltransferase [bacterium]|jgi:23S rRNA (guanosine2251-2'-O)-methyltransferase|nr:TrmH family RNA methyltransferase [bacterium]
MYIIAHDIRSLHNVGAIFRSADVFGVKKVYLTGITGTPPRKEIAKVALGSEHRVEWEQRENIEELIQELKVRQVTLVALDNAKGAIPIESLDTEGEIALVLGNEVEGVDQEIIDQVDALVEIAMPGAKQSLNVSVATGIALFALTPKTR